MTSSVRRSQSSASSSEAIATASLAGLDPFSTQLTPAQQALLEQVYIQPQQEPVNYYDAVVSAVVFDWNGMPQEYFMVPSWEESSTLAWEKAVFQVLGLRWLLMSSLNLEGFQHSKLKGDAYTIHIIRQQEHHMALLLESCELRDRQPDFLEWLCGFDLSYLRNDPRFQI